MFWEQLDLKCPGCGPEGKVRSARPVWEESDGLPKALAEFQAMWPKRTRALHGPLARRPLVGKIREKDGLFEPDKTQPKRSKTILKVGPALAALNFQASQWAGEDTRKLHKPPTAAVRAEAATEIYMNAIGGDEDQIALAMAVKAASKGPKMAEYERLIDQYLEDKRGGQPEGEDE